MAEQKQKILFLCTANSARSIFAEYLTNKIGHDRFEAYSAGSEPAANVNPLTLQILTDHYKIDAGQARSKSWDEFRDTKFDIIITVCDRLEDSCPVFPGEPNVSQWSIPDPAAASGSDEEKLRTYRETAQQIQRRVELLCALPTETLEPVLTQSSKEKLQLEKRS
jgi:arsenate reductase (thioredoxin)